MKTKKIKAILSYYDSENGFALAKTKVGNFIVDLAQLKRAGINISKTIPNKNIFLTIRSENEINELFE